MAPIECPGCKGPLSTTAEACPRCGRDVSAESFTCYECGARAPGNSEYCPACGCPLKPKATEAPPAAVAATKPCPGCDKPVAATVAHCPHCGEEVLGKVVSFCPRCRDEYIVAEADKTFTCPRCKKVCDIAEGVRLLADLQSPEKARRGLPRRRTTLRPGSLGKPALAAQVKPDSGHRFCAVAVIVAAVVLLAQGLVVSTMSDESLERLLMRTTLYGLLNAKDKAEVLRQSRSERTQAPFLVGKSLAAVLLVAIAVGLLRGRRSPTRVLAAIAAVLLGVGSVLIVFQFGRVISFLEAGVGLIAWVDLAYSLAVPVAAICCFIAAGNRLWKDPRAGVLGARIQRPRRGPGARP